MKRKGATVIALLLLGLGGACAPPNLSALLKGQLAPETGSLAAPPAPYETAAVVSGTPTQVYALVARGVLGCWFGAGGPLKGSHVFQAEAEPPAKGGAAKITIHERDVSLRDQRGPRAYRVSIASEAVSVRIGMSALRFEPAQAQVMARDVEAWAKGDLGCRLRAFLPPTPVADKPNKRPGASKKR